MMEAQIRRYAAAFGWIDRVCAVRDAQGRLIVELYGDGIADILRQGEGFSRRTERPARRCADRAARDGERVRHLP